MEYMYIEWKYIQATWAICILTSCLTSVNSQHQDLQHAIYTRQTKIYWNFPTVTQVWPKNITSQMYTVDLLIITVALCTSGSDAVVWTTL